MKLIVILVVFSVSFSLGCLNCRRRKTCETGWTQINRTLGVWCVQILTSATVFNYSEATSMCNEVGAVLSSIESQAEFEIEVALANSLNVTNTILGSQLTPACNCFTSTLVTGCPITTECNFTSAYEWTDNFTVGTTVIDSDESPFVQLLPEYLPYLVIYESTIVDTDDYGLIELDSIEDWNDITGALCGKRPF